VKRSSGPVRLRYAIGTGAARFGLLAAGFCALFVVAMIASDLTSDSEGWVSDAGSPADVLVTGGYIFLVMLLLALPMALLGGLLGAMELPLARRLTPGSAASVAGSVVTAVTLLVAPWPFADEMHGLFEHLLFWLAPSAFLGLAAAWEAYRLSRRAHQR